MHEGGEAPRVVFAARVDREYREERWGREKRRACDRLASGARMGPRGIGRPRDEPPFELEI